MTNSDPFDEVALAIRFGHTTNSDHIADRDTATVDGFRD